MHAARLTRLAMEMSGVNGSMNDSRIISITAFAKQWELSNCTCIGEFLRELTA
jgi:hypothetical protein